jgi:hypothetical protein
MATLLSKLPVEILAKILSFTPKSIDVGEILVKADPSLKFVIPFTKLLEYDPVSQPEIFKSLF